MQLKFRWYHRSGGKTLDYLTLIYGLPLIDIAQDTVKVKALRLATRKDLLLYPTITYLQRSFFKLFMLRESNNFLSILGGIIGGKTLGYLPLIYGLPLIDIGVSMFLYGADYGRDPRAFIGWANETKLSFFYAMLSAAGVSVILCFVIIFNISTPQTRKDSVVEQLSSQGTGLTIMVMTFSMTWGFAFPAYIRFPDKETPDFFPIFQGQYQIKQLHKVFHNQVQFRAIMRISAQISAVWRN